MMNIEIILSPAARIFAKLAMLKAVGLRRALAYRGPTFKNVEQFGDDVPFNITRGVVAVQTGSETFYYYPLNTVARVKVTPCN